MRICARTSAMAKIQITIIISTICAFRFKISIVVTIISVETLVSITPLTTSILSGLSLSPSALTNDMVSTIGMVISINPFTESWFTEFVPFIQRTTSSEIIVFPSLIP